MCIASCIAWRVFPPALITLYIDSHSSLLRCDSFVYLFYWCALEVSVSLIFLSCLRNNVSGFLGLFVHRSICTMPRSAKTASAAFTLSAPPPSLTSAPVSVAVTSVPCCVSGATSYAGITSSAVASDPGHGAPRMSTSVAPALVDQTALYRGFLAYLETQKLVSSAVSSLAPVQTTTNLVYTAAPSGRPVQSSVVGLPPGTSPFLAPVRGSGSGRGWGPQGRPPLRDMVSSFPARLVATREDTGLERDRSWGAPYSWGNFGEGAPTAVGDQTSLGLDYGEYGFSSDPYRPHTFEHQPPSDFGSEFEVLDHSALPEDDFSGDVDNYRGVDPRAVDREARSILYRYMGDLYRDASDTVGEPSHGAGSELGGCHTAPNIGLFSDAPRRRSGINLPSEFGTEFSRLDSTNDFKAVPRGSDSTFLINDPGHSKFFGPKRFAPETVAFANSLRDPVSANKSPLDSKEFKRDYSHWSFVHGASSLAGRLAIYSAALADILCRAVDLEVSEEDVVTVRALLLEISAMQFSQAARLSLFAIERNRHNTLTTIGLRDRLNVNAAVRIPRDGEFLFGGKLLDCVDSDITMHKRAREVAGRLAKPRFSANASRGQRFSPFTSLSSRGRGQPFRARGRGYRRSVRGRGMAQGRGSPLWSSSSGNSRK